MKKYLLANDSDEPTFETILITKEEYQYFLSEYIFLHLYSLSIHLEGFYDVKFKMTKNTVVVDFSNTSDREELIDYLKEHIEKDKSRHPTKRTEELQQKFIDFSVVLEKFIKAGHNKLKVIKKND